MSGAVLRNIEAGVKTDLSLSQFLNIARALAVSPIFLLTSIREPNSSLDIPNLSDDLSRMTAIEFDEWMSGSSTLIHDWTTAEDHNERSQLSAMRELERQVRERNRLTLLIEQATERDSNEVNMVGDSDPLTLRKEESSRQIARLTNYLQTAGWNVQRWI